ncbi:MAG: nitronate monooxygenase family protein [Candidatus Omnitrophota bacterium]
MQIPFKGLDIGGVRIEVPIIQGGMGVRVSSSSLASAVSNEGGLGVLAAVGLGVAADGQIHDYRSQSRAELVKAIRETREKTAKPFGVNVMCALTNYDDLIDAAQEEGVAVIISGAGLPLKMPSLIKNTATKIVPIVSSARAARIICGTWQRRYDRLPDAIVVEGPLAGGHLGYSMEELNDSKQYHLDKILAEVIEVAREFAPAGSPIPVIAAGGIYDGKDIARVMKLGASGVQMATRFVCTHECDVSIKYKEAFLAAKEEDIVLIKSPVGLPGRVIRNAFVDKISGQERVDVGCVYRCLVTCDPSKVNYCIAKALLRASHGDMDNGFAMCGSNAHRIKKIISVHELMQELINDARSALAKEPSS